MELVTNGWNHQQFLTVCVCLHLMALSNEHKLPLQITLYDIKMWIVYHKIHLFDYIKFSVGVFAWHIQFRILKKWLLIILNKQIKDFFFRIHHNVQTITTTMLIRSVSTPYKTWGFCIFTFTVLYRYTKIMLNCVPYMWSVAYK